MKKKIGMVTFLSVLIGTVILTACATLVISQLFSIGVFNGSTLSLVTKMSSIKSLIKNDYYGEYDENALTDKAISGYINGLGDKYAYYFNAEQATEYSDGLKGTSQGIGINIVKHPVNGTIYICKVHKDSPAELAGLQKGDEIIKVNDSVVTDVGYSEAYDMIRESNGADFNLTINRNGEESTVTLKFSEYTVQSVFYEMIDNYAYIGITEFNDDTTPTQFKNAVNQAMAAGATGLIFDLRNNGGGTVESAAEMIDFLVPSGNIISVKYSDGSDEVLYTSDESQIDLPMCVLVNRNTASASELFSASIRDYNKGVLIGAKTYGKGVMQRSYSLLDGSIVKFTVAEYFCANGENINGVGLTPDIEISQTDEEISNNNISPISSDSVILAAVDYLNNNN